MEPTMHKIIAAFSVVILLAACGDDDYSVAAPAVEQFVQGKTTVAEVEKVLGAPLATMPMADGSSRHQWAFKQSGFSGTEPETKVMTATVTKHGVLKDFSVN
jgi:hypothetical protein